MVEQWDTDASATPLAPPVLTRTWFHTGVFLGRERISNYHAHEEYHREPGWDDADFAAHLLPDTLLPPGLDVDEQREACRALKGSMLRQEVYGLDGSSRAEQPYTVTEQNFTVQLLQPQVGNRHAVFFTHPRESLAYHYERSTDDPRVGHNLTLQVDEYRAECPLKWPTADVLATARSKATIGRSRSSS